MSHTYSKIWLHFIWSTHERVSLIAPNWKSELINHFKENSQKKAIYIDTANGVSDHFHLLINLSTTQSPALVANLLKGESSNWINSNDFCQNKFAWQEGFSVFSVSHSHLSRVRKYIWNQEQHHRKMTYLEEIEKFLIAYEIGRETP